MKKGLLGLVALTVVSLGTLSANARAREFRINPGSVTPSGLATAIGFMNSKKK